MALPLVIGQKQQVIMRDGLYMPIFKTKIIFDSLMGNPIELRRKFAIFKWTA